MYSIYALALHNNWTKQRKMKTELTSTYFLQAISTLTRAKDLVTSDKKVAKGHKEVRS